MIYYGLFFLIWLIAVILMSGKGSFLIAGYNTASKERKRKYDEKKLSRVYGVGMLVIAVFVTLPYFLGEKLADRLTGIIPAVIILTIIAMILVGSFCCKSKGSEEAEDDVKEESKGDIRRFAPSVVVIVMLLLILPMLYLGKVEITCRNDGFTISVSGWKDKEIAYDEVVDIERKTVLSVGSRTGGLGTAKLLAGNFHNDTFGDYELYAYTASTEYIILYREGKTVVIGLESKEEADELYDTLVNKTGN